MKNVKPSSTATPTAESLVFSMAKMKPNATAMNTMKPMPPDSIGNLRDTPRKAPNTVGIIDKASSQ